MKLQKLSVNLPVTLMLIVFTFVVLSSDNSFSADKKNLIKLKLSQTSRVPSPGLANRYIGKTLGYYEQEGIDIEFGFTDGGSQLIQLLAAGKTNFGTTSLAALYKTDAKGKDLGLIGTYNQNKKIYYQLTTKPDSNINKTSDLKGKKIGVSSMASQAVNYVKFMVRKAGLDPEKDIRLIAVKHGIPAAKALYGGTVDVLALWDLTYAVMENNDFKLKYLPQDPIIGSVTGNAIIVKRDFLKSNPNLVVGVLRAWAKSTVFMLENPKATAKIYAEMFPSALPKGKTKAEGLKQFEEIIKIRSKIVVVDSSKGEKWGYFDRDKLVMYIKEYLRLDPNKVNVDKYYTNELIEKVNQFDENAIKKQARNY